ncbi:hypothetical protein H1Q63_14955 [Desmonostoc muscorum CCALA 125]|nr:hypothetical protein [Desmonostoc muscorum CCALA 125]
MQSREHGCASTSLLKYGVRGFISDRQTTRYNLSRYTFILPLWSYGQDTASIWLKRLDLLKLNYYRKFIDTTSINYSLAQTLLKLSITADFKLLKYTTQV